MASPNLRKEWHVTPHLRILVIGPHGFQATLVSPTLSLTTMAQGAITTMVASEGIREAVTIWHVWSQIKSIWHKHLEG
jgi:hypothetical protein